MEEQTGLNAESDLLNKLAQQKRRIARMKLVSLEDFALGVQDGNINIEEKERNSWFANHEDNGKWL